MKKGLLFGAAAGLVAIGGLMMSEQNLLASENYYTPRESEGVRYENGWEGARDYLMRRRVDPITGKIDPQDVLNARAQAERLIRQGKTDALGLQWENMGPSNIAGRTRAILFDRNNPSIMFAGSVSGGLFKSTNGGNSWTQVNDQQSNLAVTCLGQASDGTIYYGTGEGLYYGAFGAESGGMLGGGLFKSTDGGNTFQVIPSTIPVANNNTANFASIGKIEIDPNNPQRIFIATNNGIRRSDDGGTTWVNPLGFLQEAATDMDMNSNGGIWLKQGSRGYFSPNGDNGSFTQIPSNQIPFTGARARFAVAPTDDNYVYCVLTDGTGAFSAAYQTTNGGTSWNIIGQRSAVLNPHRTQGDYDNALAVSPLDKERIIVGGVELWEWSASNGWLQIASTSGGGTGSPLYVHADNHEVRFHPNRPGEIYIGNDGGVFRSLNNGITWQPLNSGYISLQLYALGVGKDGELLGGTQDNGTIFVSPKSFFPKSGVRTNSINFKGSLRDGDGGYAEISHLNPLMAFKEMQYGVLGRSADSGETFNGFYNIRRMDPAGYAGDGTNRFADFVMPFLLWEKLNEPLSEDSVTFTADSAIASLGFGNGGRTYGATFRRVQPTTKFVPEGLIIKAGQQVVTSNPLASPTDSVVTLSGDGTGKFNPTTGRFVVTFTNPVVLEISARVATTYDAGSTLFLSSATNELPLNYTLQADLDPNESVQVQDPVQAMFFVGLRAYTLATNPDQNRRGGIWMTREAISSPLVRPTWYHIAKLGENETPATMEVSHDGNTLYVGTNSGNLYRITNLNAARDSASTDVDDYYFQGALTRANTSVIQTSVIRSFGRIVTSIAVNSQNTNQVVVTLGNYGSNQYVYRTNNALASTGVVFTDITGDLPKQPYYASTFNYNDPTGQQLIVGGEDGIYTTEDVGAVSVTYTKEVDGLANVPVFALRQPRTVRYDLKTNLDFEGSIYAGTHGRGYFKTNTTADYVGVEEPKPFNNAKNKEVLNVYPNPAYDETKIALNLSGRSDVRLNVRDMSGKLVKTMSLNKVDSSVEFLPLNVSSLKNGTYIVTLQVNNKVTTGKLVVSH
jgi:photosystem II stability/assembly factor-like uncharacterized protein